MINDSSKSPFGPEEFMAATDVSRETLGRLKLYVSILEKWQQNINLVGRGTIQESWRRHMLDSAQLYNLIKDKEAALVDLGSGAGFPGMVLAIMGMVNPTLIESNGKKCSFLRQVALQTGADVTVINDRIEKLKVKTEFDIVTARALASLDILLAWSESLLAKDGRCFFLKGRDYEQELTETQKKWNISVVIHQSQSNPDSVILEIAKIKPLNGHT